jgi:hypothetical protein
MAGYPLPNTRVVSPVTVPLNGVTTTFSNVTVAGYASRTSQQDNPGGGIPSRFRLHGQFVDTVTTATHSGAITIGISYAPAHPQPSEPEPLSLVWRTLG